MVQILLDLTDDENRIVEIFKLQHKLETKKIAIKKMIKHFDITVKPMISEKDYFK